jgi:hypothetical protein
MPNWSTEDCGLCGHPQNDHELENLEYEENDAGERTAATGDLVCPCGCVEPVRIEKHRVDPTLN